MDFKNVMNFYSGNLMLKVLYRMHEHPKQLQDQILNENSSTFLISKL